MVINTTRDIMTINLAKGHFNAVNGHGVLKVNFNDLHLPNTRYVYRAKDCESRLPSISDAYETCLEAKLDQDKIIDTLLQLYFPLRLFRVGDYERMAIVLGFIGMRGSGKSCSAVMVAACDFLFRGLPVWSNVPINIRVVYKDAEKVFSSIDIKELDLLDITDDYGGGCVLYDEVNMEAAEATRYASGANLQFAYVMQQIRKRMLSFIWTCQGWSWIDNRLRWQTDFCVACRDASFEKKKIQTNGVGDVSLWRVHDLSGTSGKFAYDYELKHKYLTDYLIGSHMVWLRPWWSAYNTDQLQGQVNYISEYKKRIDMQKKQEKVLELKKSGVEISEITITLDDLVNQFLELNECQKIYCKDLWGYLNTDDKSVQTSIGRIMINKGYKRRKSSQYGYFWEKGVSHE